MKKQLKGIAIILFGILLAVIGTSMKKTFVGDYDMLMSIAGGVVGIVGLVFALGKE